MASTAAGCPSSAIPDLLAPASANCLSTRAGQWTKTGNLLAPKHSGKSPPPWNGPDQDLWRSIPKMQVEMSGFHASKLQRSYTGRLIRCLEFKARGHCALGSTACSASRPARAYILQAPGCLSWPLHRGLITTYASQSHVGSSIPTKGC